MQRHALALGYFFLSVLCLMGTSHTISVLAWALLLGAVLALFVGLGYLVWAWHRQLERAGGWLRHRLVELYKEARREPERFSQEPVEGAM